MATFIPFYMFPFWYLFVPFPADFFCGLDMELFIDKQKWRTQCGQSTKFLCLVLMLFTCGKIQYLCRECKFYGYILKLVANGKHYCNLGPLFLLKNCILWLFLFLVWFQFIVSKTDHCLSFKGKVNIPKSTNPVLWINKYASSKTLIWWQRNWKITFLLFM